MSDINEEQKRLYKRAEENDKEQVCLKVSMPLFEEKELEIFDNNIHSIIEEYSKLHLEKKEQILTQRIIIKQEKEINRLNIIIEELEKYINEEIEDYNKALNSKLLSESGKEKYEAEKVCFLDMLDKLNELKGDNK